MLLDQCYIIGVHSTLCNHVFYYEGVGSSSSTCKSSLESGELPIHSVISRDEDQDFTGDSGFSTASRYYDDHDPYCVVDLWRRHSGDATSAIGKRGVNKFLCVRVCVFCVCNLNWKHGLRIFKVKECPWSKLEIHLRL